MRLALATAHAALGDQSACLRRKAGISISSMPAAVDRKDALGVVNILRELRSFDRILYFKLG